MASSPVVDVSSSSVVDSAEELASCTHNMADGGLASPPDTNAKSGDASFPGAEGRGGGATDPRGERSLGRGQQGSRVRKFVADIESRCSVAENRVRNYRVPVQKTPSSLTSSDPAAKWGPTTSGWRKSFVRGLDNESVVLFVLVGCVCCNVRSTPVSCVANPQSRKNVGSLWGWVWGIGVRVSVCTGVGVRRHRMASAGCGISAWHRAPRESP